MQKPFEAHGDVGFTLCRFLMAPSAFKKCLGFASGALQSSSLAQDLGTPRAQQVKGGGVNKCPSEEWPCQEKG